MTNTRNLSLVSGDASAVVLERARALVPVLASRSAATEANRRVPEWLDRGGVSAKVLRMPGREDVDMPINEDLILAYYAR